MLPTRARDALPLVGAAEVTVRVGSSVWDRGRGRRWAGHAGGHPGALIPVHELPVWLLPCSARGVRLRGRQPPPQTPSGSPRPSAGPGTTAHLPLFPANTPLPHAALPCQPSGVLQVSRPGLCCSVLGSRERVCTCVHACAGVCAMHARCQPRANTRGPHPAQGVGRRGPLWELPPVGEARPQGCTSVYSPSPPGLRWLLAGACVCQENSERADRLRAGAQGPVDEDVPRVLEEEGGELGQLPRRVCVCR